MGYDFNDTFLNVITDKGKGAYFACITKNDAKKNFQDRFISLVQVAAREVKFRLDFPYDLIHIDSGSEESSKDPNKVQATNFSYINNIHRILYNLQ